MSNKDWTGNQRSIYTILGASNHVVEEREKHDYYATDPFAMELLLREEEFAPHIWECACGEFHLTKVLEDHGYDVYSTDLIDRGCGIGGVDFLQCDEVFDGDIITNPPYKSALEFCQKALELIHTGNKVAMFLKLQFLEGKARKPFFLENPPKTIYVSSSRLKCAKNGDFDSISSSAVAYAWFVWEKGFKGDPSIKWIN